MSNGRSTPVRVSIRLRLTLWNASVLALLLSVFGVASWITMRGVLQARANTTVSESARAIAGAVLAERQGARRIADSTRVVRTAVRDALRELHIGDFDVLIVDDAARVVAANRVPTRRRANTRPGAHIAPTPPVDPDTVALSPPVRELLRLKPLGNETLLRSLTIDDQIWRAALVRVGPGIVDSLEPALIVGVLRSDEEDVAVLDRVRTTLLLAIPFALAVTILVGYLLARRSLAPVEEMAASAARISAATLDERLPVSIRTTNWVAWPRWSTISWHVDVAFRVQRRFVADVA
ncbi:MAG: hypothetical protein IPP90_06010 [Gemmatimonadaceae bacterium]|nr:hypothetical protein [Gemmatimonadaceae bacterium]